MVGTITKRVLGQPDPAMTAAPARQRRPQIQSPARKHRTKEDHGRNQRRYPQQKAPVQRQIMGVEESGIDDLILTVLDDIAIESRIKKRPRRAKALYVLYMILIPPTGRIRSTRQLPFPNR